MSTSRRQRLLLIVAALAVGFLLVDKIVVTPLTDLWKERSAKIRVLRGSVDKGEALLRRESFLVRRWDDMQEGSLTRNQSQAEDDVLSQVDRWSRSAGVNINSYTPQWRSDAEDHSKVEVRLEGMASMGSLVKFMHQMDGKELPLRMDMLTLTARDKVGSQLGFEMRLSGLTLTGGEE